MSGFHCSLAPLPLLLFYETTLIPLDGLHARMLGFTGIDEAIRLHDKLLLILSKSSVASGWVEREVKTALAKERKEKRTVLFPVRVDKAVFESPFDWATQIRHERNIGDFTRWKYHDEYEQAFTRLLRDLKAETRKPDVR